MTGRPTALAAAGRAALATAGCAVLLLTACGGAPGAAPASGARVVAEPGVVIFSPAHETAELRLVNPGDAPVALSRIRLDPRGPDWGAFMIEDRQLPREIAAHDAVSLHLRVDGDHFAGPRARAGSAAGARPGRSHLLFQADGDPHAIDLRFQPDDPAAALNAALLRLAVLAGLVASAWALARRTRTPISAWTTWLPALALVCVLPWGPALCPSQLGQVLSPADLEQCAEGRGGHPLLLVPAAEGWLIYLLALVAAGLGRLAHAAGDPSQTAIARRLASRDLALAAAFAGPLLSFGTLDPRVLLADQALPLTAAISWLPRWGAIVQPIAAILAITVAAAPHAPRLDRLAATAALAAIFFGGPTTLPLAGTPHALALAAGLGVLAAKVAALSWLIQRLSTAGSRARLRLASLEQISLPLGLVSLLVTSAYLAWR